MRSIIICIFSLFLISSINDVQAQYRRYSGRGYYSGHNYNYYHTGGYYRSGYHSYGERVYLHRPALYLNFGGYGYRYLDGSFYRPYGSYFEVVAPPIGIHVGVLPYGYSRLRVGPGLFYYYNGIYYRRYNDYYEVVTPPLGAVVADLPPGAREVIIDHKRYYDYYGTLYSESTDENGEVVYTVTGKNGEVMTEPQDDEVYDNRPETAPRANNKSSEETNTTVHTGTEVSSLPEGSKTVVLNNKKYFVSPDDTYYEELIDNNQIYYRVVTKPTIKN